jgi:hypothetical protein
MKVLSIKQPWAWAILAGHKRVENRSWPTDHRGPLAIHAGRQDDPEGYRLLAELGIEVPDDLPRGAIVGTVELLDVVRVEDGPTLFDTHDLGDDPFATGPFCWILGAPQPLPQPVQCRGRLGLFEVQGSPPVAYRLLRPCDVGNSPHTQRGLGSSRGSFSHSKGKRFTNHTGYERREAAGA